MFENLNNMPNGFNGMMNGNNMENGMVEDNNDYFLVYTIEKGDSIYGIARRYNINPALLSSLNGLNMEDYIYPGDKILIPKSGYSYYMTAEGDTIDSVANTFNTDKNTLLNENDTIYLLSGQLLVHKKN